VNEVINFTSVVAPGYCTIRKMYKIKPTEWSRRDTISRVENVTHYNCGFFHPTNHHHRLDKTLLIYDYIYLCIIVIDLFTRGIV